MYRMMKRTPLALCALALSVATASAEIKIGIAAPLTGVYASLSGQIITGVKFAADEINKNGGIKGEPIVIETIDDKCEPEAAQGIANQFVGKGVIAVIGHLCDRPSIEASPIYSENKIVQLSPTSQNPAFTENRLLPNGGTYRLAALKTQQSEALTAFMVKHSVSKDIAIVNDGSVYGKGLADAIIESLKAEGITPVFSADFESGEERYRRLSGRIVDSGATLLFIGGIHLDAAALIRDIDRLSDKITVIGGDGLVHTDFPKLVMEDNPNRNNLDGIFSSFPLDPRKLPSAKEVVERFKAGEQNPAGLTLRGYSAMKILEAALNNAETSDFESLNKVLNEQSFQTPIGTITFNDKGDADLVDYVIHQWRDNTIDAVN